MKDPKYIIEGFPKIPGEYYLLHTNTELLVLLLKLAPRISKIVKTGTRRESSYYLYERTADNTAYRFVDLEYFNGK